MAPDASKKRNHIAEVRDVEMGHNMDFRSYLEERRSYLSKEEVRRLLVGYYRGRDLRYKQGVQVTVRRDVQAEFSR